MDIEVGRTYEVPFPFVMEEISFVREEGAEGMISWRPGTQYYRETEVEYTSAAHGMGLMLLHVVSIHRPGNYPTRVFYTRQWRDPRHRIFGKNSLLVTTVGNFKVMLRGYRHDFILDPDMRVISK